MRLIDADALDMYEWLKSYYGDAWRDAQKVIDNAPTVDAVPVRHGEWLERNTGFNFGTCSCCGDRWGAVDVMKYCPNCGAKMDGAERKEE